MSVQLMVAGPVPAGMMCGEDPVTHMSMALLHGRTQTPLLQLGQSGGAPWVQVPSPGSRHVPLEELEDELDELALEDELDDELDELALDDELEDELDELALDDELEDEPDELALDALLVLPDDALVAAGVDAPLEPLEPLEPPEPPAPWSPSSCAMI
jgi:hypothetical protein